MALAAVATLGVGQVRAAGADPPELGESLGARPVRVEQEQRPLPRPSGTEKMKPAIRSTLERGFAIAVKFVRQNPTCAALFQRLGADGEYSLKMTLYLVVPYEDKQRCESRNALALTRLGSPLVKLCPAFARLGKHDAALALIHEALHRSGLPEWPPTPGAMTAQEIQTMVESACSAGGQSPLAAHPAGVVLTATSSDLDH